MCRPCLESVHWPTSNPSLKNSWTSLLPAVIQYLRLKIRGILDNPGPAKVQQSALSDDR
jgi:hypothetical protein